MQRRIWLWQLIPLLLVTSAPPAAAQRKAASVDVAAARAAIERANAQWAAAANRGDAAGVASLYTEDALYMAPDAPAVLGRAAIQKLAAVNVRVLHDARLTTAELEVFGSSALERGTYDMILQPAGSAPAPLHGKYLVEWKLGGDGAWRMHRQVFNSDQPAPRGPARATPGDSVLVVFSHVKPEMRAEWERQARETWLATWQKIGQKEPAYAAAAADIRILAPTRPDADGSYTYLVLADPHHPGMDYDARGSLARIYESAKAEELIRAWVATFARPQEARMMVQQP